MRPRPPRRLATEFFGNTLLVSRGVFVPQPASEELVRAALSSATLSTVVEVGSGSGAISLAIARARPQVEVLGTDSSRRAVKCATANRRRLGVRNARFYFGQMIEPLRSEAFGRADVVIANLPYLAPESLRASRLPSPARTFQGVGADGLDLPRSMARQAKSLLRKGGKLILQVDDTQASKMRRFLQEVGYQDLGMRSITGSQAAVVSGSTPWSDCPRPSHT